VGLARPKLIGDLLMFAPYCETHRSRVLLPTTAITALEHTEDGMVARFVCSCGQVGVWHAGQS
jgi:hypothetical protein